MEKLIAFAGLIAAYSWADESHAQGTVSTGEAVCLLVGKDSSPPPEEQELLAYQQSLTERSKELASQLKSVSATNEALRVKLGDKIELNRVAQDYVQKALAQLAKRRSSLAECEAALKRSALVNRVAEGSGHKETALKAETERRDKSLIEARAAHESLKELTPAVRSYTELSLGEGAIRPRSDTTVIRRTEVGMGIPDEKVPPCSRMIDKPAVTLDVSKCGSDAIVRSVRTFAGGDIAFPSSVLRPRGIAANLAGSSTDGTVSISLADSFKRRRYPKDLPDNLDTRVQLPWEIGYSVSVKAKDGLIFSRKDTNERIKDSIDGNAIVSVGLLFNVYKGETLREWNSRAAKLTDAAIKACLKDQSSGESKEPSTCTGESLTNWVYGVSRVGTVGAYLHPDLAKQADDLYFRSMDDKPIWGGGFDLSFSRGNYDFLDPNVFIADATSENKSDGEWNYGATLYGYWRLGATSSSIDVSLIPSVSYNSNFGYLEGTSRKQFCQATEPSKPYVTGACPSYYESPPTRIKSWIKALELRILTPKFASIPALGFSPKLSREDILGSTTDRWYLEIPFLAFVEKEKGLGVGLQYSREWGGRKDVANKDGVFESVPADDKLKIVVTKTFSLTGK